LAFVENVEEFWLTYHVGPDGGWVVKSRATIWNSIGRLGFASRSAMLASSSFLIWVVSAAIGYKFSGDSGLIAATLAGVVCLVASELALIVLQLLRDPKLVLHGVVIGMMIRMGLPLLVGGFLQLNNQGLANAGLLYYVLVFYLATLLVETALVVSHLQNSHRSQGSL